MPVIPATKEAEAEELLEPGRQRSKWVEIVPLHSHLGYRVRLCLKKREIKLTQRNISVESQNSGAQNLKNLPGRTKLIIYKGSTVWPKQDCLSPGLSNTAPPRVYKKTKYKYKAGRGGSHL